ncbi:MICAL-like protein 1 isoform X2 [Zeugodacus cucurbitae]|uniref:MICAL-like protein 1 isoform X2 n=1 Tax=Zeugodacus cucurbitae TaxID=28588 RepID=UPI0023D90667|nr:MICAL-like protein 1 isoform X2 [Zeugodacus cucurbitae]
MGERRGTKALELWCRRMTDGYPGVKIDNMTTSWRDGLAFCAMIHHFRPDLIEFDKLNKSDVYYNNELAFTTAEKYLGIPALLDAVDMATYEVPDRLSILTYLSQFYQVFAAQDSPNRLKRPSPAASAEKTQITKAAGPPPKMAHVVGVPKRDPCQKCQLPVFLAERLLVGKKVYHRTCLKCARCGSQLTPGSFYETEVDGEYCCETCPDEEVQLNAPAAGEELAVGDVQLRQPSAEQTPTSSSSLNAALPKNVRSSIADRLAFFEQSKKDAVASDSSEAATSSKFLLQKSVSDEEKSKSLQRMEAPTTSAYKMNSALSSFLNDTIDGEGDDGESLTNTVDSKSGTETQMETSDTENETDAETSLDDVAPALPKTEPPKVTPEGSDVEREKAQSPTPDNRRFTATAQLQLGAANKENMENVEPTKKTTPTSNSSTGTPVAKKRTQVQLNLTAAKTAEDTAAAAPTPPQARAELQADNANNNGQHKDASKDVSTKTPEQKAQSSLTATNNLVLSEPNSNEDVTKDQNAATNVIAAATTTTSNAEKLETLRANLRELDTESGTENMDMSVEKSVEMRIKSLESPEDVATTERLSVVRARLQQFEVIANKRNNNAEEEKQADNDTRNDNNTTLNTEDKLSEPETDNTNIDKDKKLMNVDAEEENNTVAPATPPPATPTSNAASATESLTKVNLEDEAKLRAIETEKADKIETKANEIKESLVNEVPLEMETAKDNNIVLDVSEREAKPEPKTQVAAPRIEISAAETNEDATMVDTQPKQETPNTDGATKIPADASSKAPEATTAENLATTPSKVSTVAYPEDLNPFKSEDEDDECVANKETLQKQQVALRTPQPRAVSNSSAVAKSAEKTQNLNPFDSSDDEIELEKPSSRTSTAASTPTGGKVPPPRPPPPRISRNPFGEETDEEAASQFSRHSSLSSSLTKKTPVPTPRTNLDYYGSANSLGSTPQSLQRNTDLRGSNNSLTSSAGGTIRSRKSRKAPAPPTPLAKELFPTATPPPPSATSTIPSDRQTDSSKASTPSSSTVGTPKMSRKKRPAPAPPKPARLDPSLLPTESPAAQHTNGTAPKNSLNYPLQSETSDSKLSDEEKALLEGNKQLSMDSMKLMTTANDDELSSQASRRSSRRIIPLDASLLLDDDEHLDADANADGDGKCDDAKQKQQLLRYSEQEETNVVYRRVIVPPCLETPTRESNSLLDGGLHDRQLEKLKDNKEAQNRNRQSQISASSGAEDCDITTTPYNKSAHGKWKRRKGPAPALPIPPRKVLQMLPLQEIRHELDIIEVQQQGLEKQGVILEKMIRDRCEGQNGELLGANSTAEDAPDGKKTSTSGGEGVQNSKEVEDLILQLFELVNEKNELFRRQAELMYLRRQHRLEQEQADLEYEIRVLMAQPERNKTDSDKAREETLIARLVEVVQLRNEVVECLEMDRLREAEEDLSIKQRLELHTAQREEDTDSRKITSKLSKKEKKKQKESKKLSKSKKIDADKDADESELNMDKQKLKKKKKKFLF